MIATLMKYNPAFLDDETLIRSFVARHAELDVILEILRENTGDANQHVLVIGPRGIGKTTLVLRVAAETRADADLSERWHPVIYGEESYSVASPGEFWMEAVFHVGEQTNEPRWKGAYQAVREEPDEDRLRERALAQLMDFADERGRRLLLVVENLNMLFGGQMNSQDAWVLRHTLMNEPRLMLLGTATRRFEEIDDYDRAFYDLFRLVDLDPLKDDEARAVWRLNTGEVPSPVEIRPIQILTGGNPRLIRILSEFAAGASFQELMTNLIQLVDEHTEYFKLHLDNLAPQERKVFVALADLWDPSSAREVSEAARLDVNHTSAVLNRLSERGAVSVSFQRGRTKYYQVAERMYSVYHLMRRRGGTSSRVRAVVRFMIHLYRGDDLLRTVACERALELDPEEAAGWGNRGGALNDPERFEEALVALERALELDPENAFAWRSKGAALENLDRHEEAITALERALALEPVDVYSLNSLAWALYVGGPSERLGEGEILARQAVEQEPEEGAYRHTLACILGAQGRWPEALSQAGRFLQDEDMLAEGLDEVIAFFIQAAAAGYVKESLHEIETSPGAEALEPLAVALRMILGEAVRVAVEIKEVARDVVKRIEARRAEKETSPTDAAATSPS